MKRTILVDDDFLVRSYLKTLPAWEKAGFCIEADVRDGEEALAELEKKKADLIVTDISMPLVDGIELIKRIRKRDQLTYIIVLSCHDDFEYVKEAMREGADEYILKNTLEDDSLYQLLVNTEKKMEGRKHPKNAVEESSFQENAVWTGDGDLNQKYLFFNRVLAGSIKGEEREQGRIKAGIKGNFQNSAVVIMLLESWDEKEELWSAFEKDQYCLGFMGRLRNAMQELSGYGGEDLEAMYLGSGVFCCFLDLSGIWKSSEMHQNLTNVASACYKICKSETYTFKIGVSNVCIGAEAIRQAYQQARAIMKFGFYDLQDIAYYDACKKMGTVLPQEAEELLSQTDMIRYGNDREGFQKSCKKVRKAFEAQATDSRLVIQWLKSLEQKLGTAEAQEYGSLHSMDQVYSRMEASLDVRKRSVPVQIPEKAGKTVRIAAEYVRNHYREAIGLTDAAQAANVNSAYLSYLFRQEMGVGFSSFLLEQRMEYARNMLKETNLKIRIVAEEAGFNDYHYFSKTFKKLNGQSPADYRQKN